MESNYKKYISDAEARKKAILAAKEKKEEWSRQQTEQAKLSVSMAESQTKNIASNADRSQNESNEKYHSRQKILMPKPPLEEPSEKPNGGYRKNYGAKAGGSGQLPEGNHREDEQSRRKQLEDEVRKRAIYRARRIASRIARQAAQRTGQLAAQAGKIVVRAAIQAAGSILVAAAGAIGWMGCLIIIIIIAAIAVIVWVYKTCETNVISSAICTSLSWVGSALSWVWSWF